MVATNDGMRRSECTIESGDIESYIIEIYIVTARYCIAIVENLFME